MTKPYESPFKMRSITTAATITREIGTEMRVAAAIKNREEWMSDGNKWDTVIPGRVSPTGIKYVVVDLETHDWKCNDPLLADGRIVEIAWKLFSDTGDCLESRQYLVKPYGSYKEIAPKATEVHGITTEYASKHGVDVDMVLGEFIDIVKNIPNDGFVIAHNMEHEHTVLTNSFSPSQRIVWNAVPKSDTHSVPLLKFLPEPVLTKYYRGSKLQWRKWGLALSELHRNISPDPEAHTLLADNAHFACTDVDMTWEIFQYYKLHAPNGLLTWMKRSNEAKSTEVQSKKRKGSRMPSTPKDKFNALMKWKKKALM